MDKTRAAKPAHVHSNCSLGFVVVVLLIITLLATAAGAQSSSSSSSAQTSNSSAAASAAASSSSSSTANRGGQDCSQNSAICSPGLLCLPSSGGGGGSSNSSNSSRRVCRRPQKYEPCGRATPCDDSDPRVALACQPVFEMGPEPYFPGQTCVQLFGRGQKCDPLFNACRPGLTCGLLMGLPFCVSATRAAVGQDCADTDCADNLVCKKNTDGSRRCANEIPEGQTCNLKDYDASVNPCLQYFGRTLRCIDGICSKALQMGATCTLPDYQGQCDFSPSGGGLSCVKSETGDLKCLMTLFVSGPCGDSINTGCDTPGKQCIKGYCGAPNGGDGDVCGPQSACKPGLKCLESSISGAGSRCTVLQDEGGSCDPQLNFTSCKDGLKCASSFNTLTCVSGPVPIGGKCIQGKSECVTGLSCIANNTATSQLSGYEGICKQVSQLGGVCNPSIFQICDRAVNDFSDDLPQLECVNRRCVNKSVGIWRDKCGSAAGATCAPQDEVAKLECVRNMCVRVNVSLGLPCQWPNRFGPSDGTCASNLRCLAFDQPEGVTKCVRLALDSEQCDFNNFTGCQNSNSSCIRGICTSS
jgi:type II secretory pathway pseudopilin PulG